MPDLPDYGFSERLERRRTHSLKWAFPEKFLKPDQISDDLLPMWVADMDFRAAPEIRAALTAASEDGVFGYPLPTPSYVEAVRGWQRDRFGWEPPADSLIQTPGIVTGIGIIVQAFSQPGDRIIIHDPVYAPFCYIPELNGRAVVHSPLRRDGDRYHFDAERFEADIREHRPRLFILCNPHNPTGNVWSHDDLRQMAEICAANGVLVISDEIHQDLIFDPAQKHIPFALLGDVAAQNTIVCTAPSKTFNLAGLQVSNLFVPNPDHRALLQQHLAQLGMNFVNQLGMVACEAAYRHGGPWLDALLAHLRAQHARVDEACRNELAPIRWMPTGALYLAWLDCSALGMDDDTLNDFFLKQAKVWLDRGIKFGSLGSGFMRINLGCPRETLEEGIARIAAALERRNAG